MMTTYSDKKNLTRDETLALAKKWLADVASSRAVVLLEGPLGAGKTQWMKWVLAELGSDETISPSFALHLQYKTDRGIIHHLDLYRIQNQEELESIGFWDLFYEKYGIIFIEWPERLDENDLPRSWPIWKVKITPSQVNASNRDLLITKS